MTNVEVSSFCIDNGIRTRKELLAKANIQKKEGKLDLAAFVLNRTSKAVTELVETAWDMENAAEDLQKLDRERMTVVYDQADLECTPGCEDELWLKSALEVLTNNNIDARQFASSLVALVSKGRGKFRNVLLVGPTNCGKTF